ncbi:MAG: serine/threonine protein kinase [Deltaproteobacteria bacterium]|nr:serine/threonine protein kinase [Deltaproteobacteria bacterium]
MTAPANEPIPGPLRFGDFEVVGALGQGGSGIVYDARWGHREVALKVLHPSLVATEKEREQFLLEARRLAEISHPGVVKVLSVGQLPDGRPYLAMEKLGGQTLAARLGDGRMPPLTALRLFGQLADAVAALHDRGLVHRDLKPENVFLVGNAGAPEHAVLLDFGIAKELAAPASTTTQDGGVRGTPAYMAPERFFGSPAAIATDIYELAVVLFAMLAGRLPWDDCGDPEVRLNPLRLADCAPDLPAALDAVVARALSTRAANRPESVRGFAGAVVEASGHGLGLDGPRTTSDLRALPVAAPAEAWFQKTTSPERRQARASAPPPSGDAALGTAPTMMASTARRPRRRRWALVGALGAVAVGGAVASAVTRGGGATSTSSPPSSVDDPWAAAAASGAGERSPDPGPGSAAPVKALTRAPPPPPAPPRSDRPLRTELAASVRVFASDTHAIIGLVVDELRQHPDTAPMIAAATRDPRFTALLHVDGCELDFGTAVDWLAIGTSARSADLVVSGRWSRDQIEACLGGARGSAIERSRGAGGVQLTRLHGALGDRWLAWLDDRTFMTSTRDNADGAWLAARVAATAGPGGRVGELAKEVDRDATLWMAVDRETLEDTELAKTVPMGDAFGHAVLGEGVKAAITVRYADVAAATKAAAAMTTQFDDMVGGPQMRTEMNIFSAEVKDRDVLVGFDISAAILKAVAASAAAERAKTE